MRLYEIVAFWLESGLFGMSVLASCVVRMVRLGLLSPAMTSEKKDHKHLHHVL